MSKCRACLKSLRNMITFDEKNIKYFNILTNLNLELSPGDPQHLCKHCFKTLQQFIEFREKCIAANAVFSDVILKESIKQEDSFNIVSHEIEVKQETEVDDYEAITPFQLDDYYGAGDGESKYDNNFVYEFISKTEGKIEEKDKSKDIKRTKRETKYTKKKATCEENRKRKDVKKTKRKTKYKKKAPNDEISETKNINIKKTKEKEKNIIYEFTSATSLPCGLCTKKFEDNTQLDLHILSTHKSSNSCVICEEKFVDWQELISHRTKHLPGGRHPCHLCPTKFKTAIYMEYHFRKDHHTEGEKQTLRCRICDRRYPTPRRLYFHTTETHNTKNRMFICDFCDKVCFTKPLIKAHLLTHLDCKLYCCDLCGFSSNYKTTITAHKMAKHNPDRVYCSKCKKLFASAALRAQHACTRPDASDMCPVCGKTCSRLKRHMLVHKEGQPFACARCPARFRTRASLAIHMDKHAGVRRHACDLCPAKFYFPAVLIKHRRTHTGYKPYVCKECQKAFTGSNNLKVHMRVHGKFLIKKKEESLHEEMQIQKIAPSSRC